MDLEEDARDAAVMIARFWFEDHAYGRFDPHLLLQGKAARSHQPCAACRMLRRRCDNNCLLAPYFPADDVHKFVGVHKVFGASNVIKMIQMVEERKREDAVKGIVYEAMARIRDPVYGSAGSVLHLQKMIEQLKAELECIRSRVSELREEKDHLLTIIDNSSKTTSTSSYYGRHHHHHLDDPLLFVPMNDNEHPAAGMMMLDGSCTTSTFSVDDQLMAFDYPLLEFEHAGEFDYAHTYLHTHLTS